MKKYIPGIILSLFVLAFSSFIFINRVNDDASFKQDFLDLINETRAKGCKCGNTYMPPAPPMVWNSDLEEAARGHAKDMAKQNYFSHDSKDGRSMNTRIVTAGYIFKGWKSFMIGENIAQGQTTIPEVMAGWFKSEGHCKNLMNPGFKEVGVAEYNKYWVQDFGGREAFSKEQQELIKSGKYRLIQKD
ncbi:CAP domain-containing protein [Mucilaginibacter terrigena]|uniref:CAP domain-containing protein n=1 Tax=Mucilaginibacter terrigena TaxID=2492395 RepID=A0A4Q5LRE1_9SPHI|nr:CAP domain-containing protein [Mucilaginibacter terrigena]RYU92007.1 CAP domain-containing protein [Mucilaginibacter terrigena]